MLNCAIKIFEYNNHNFFMSLRAIAVLLSLLNAHILSKLKSSIASIETVYKFLRIVSLVDAGYSAGIFTISFMGRTCPLASLSADPCSATTHLILIIAYVILSEYLTSCLAIFNIIMECFLTVQRIIVILNKTSKFANFQRVGLVSSLIFVFSFAIYAPVLFMTKPQFYETLNFTRDGKPASFKNDYVMAKTKFGKTKLALWFVNGLTIARMFMVIVVLLILNIIVIAIMKLYLNKTILRQQAPRDTGNNGNSSSGNATESRYNNRSYGQSGGTATLLPQVTEQEYMVSRVALANKKLTRMLIMIASLYIIGNIPYLLYYLVRKTYDHCPIVLSCFSQLFSNLLIILKIFVYAKYNKCFRKHLVSFLIPDWILEMRLANSRSTLRQREFG